VKRWKRGKVTRAPYIYEGENTPGYSGSRAGDSGARSLWACIPGVSGVVLKGHWRGPGESGKRARILRPGKSQYWRCPESPGKGPDTPAWENAVLEGPGVSGKSPGYSGLADS